jgi:protoporphyrinogen oxidase
MAPPGRTSVCLEIFATPGDGVWRQPDDAIVARCAADLERIGLVRPAEIEMPRVVRVPGAYPVWRVGYEEPLARLREAVASLPGIHPLGRTGNYEYLNIDGVVARAWELVDGILGKAAPRRVAGPLVVP